MTVSSYASTPERKHETTDQKHVKS